MRRAELRTLAVLALPALGLAALLAGCRGGLRPLPTRPAASPPVRLADDAPAEADPIALDLLDRHNRIRAGRDLPPLSFSGALAEAARGHVQGMIGLGKIRHKGADGSSPADRVERAGYRYVTVGENVAAGQGSAEEVMDGWMNSPGHRRNILGDFVELGAARAEDADGRPYWCVVFASPLPRLDPAKAAAALRGRINSLRSEEGLPPFPADAGLDALALEHARAMAGAGSLDPPGPAVGEALAEAGIPFRRAARSVASGSPGPEEVLEAMADDPGNRRNLLGTHDRAGVGYAAAEDGRPYWSVLLVEGGEPSP